MWRFWGVLVFVALLAGCESAPQATTAEGTVGVGAIRTERDRCAALGHVPGSDEMIACMRAGETAVP